MICLSKKRDKIIVSGHSNNGHGISAEEHQACASVTVLTQTLINGITELLGEHIDYELDKGYFELSLLGLSEQARLLVNTFLLGYCDLSTAYPKQVSIVDKVKH